MSQVGIFRLLHFPTKRHKFKIDSTTDSFLLIWKPEAYLMNKNANLYSLCSRPPGLPGQSQPRHQWGGACDQRHVISRCRRPSLAR